VGRVIVIGNAGLDLRLTVPRLPGPGETLIGQESARAPGGKGLNQAVMAARCGAEVRFCAPLGNDEPQAHDVEAYLSREPIAERMLLRTDHPTDFSLVMVLPDGENSIVSTSACSLAMKPEQMAPALRDVGEGDVVLLQGNLSIETTDFLLAAARERKARTIFNPAPFWPGAEKLMGHCSVVVANKGEAASLGEALAAAEQAIVTLGREGCVLIEAGHCRSFAAQPVMAVDTTGCGDAFCGALAAMLASGQSIDQAINVAQKAAALTATKPGAFDALPSSAELTTISGPRAP